MKKIIFFPEQIDYYLHTINHNPINNTYLFDTSNLRNPIKFILAILIKHALSKYFFVYSKIGVLILKIYIKKMSKYRLESDVILVIFHHSKMNQKEIIDSLKIYSQYKIVLYIDDSIISEESIHNQLKFNYDIFTTFDYNDSIKYNLVYYRPGFQIRKKNYVSKLPSAEVIFLGKDKGRISKLLEIAILLEKKGISFLFIIETKQQIKSAQRGIMYITKKMKYDDYLSIIYKSNYILDLTTNNQTGLSLRYFEALVMNKNILSDNSLLSNKTDVIYFKDVSEINLRSLLSFRNEGYITEQLKGLNHKLYWYCKIVQLSLWLYFIYQLY